MRPAVQTTLATALLLTHLLIGCGGGSTSNGPGPAAAAGTSAAGSGGTSNAGMGGTGAINSSGTGAVDTSAGGLNPTDCAIPGGTPTGTATGTVGTWENVTPSQLDMQPTSFNSDNYGVQDMLVDPAIPSDVYTFVCHQGVWKSSDYGASWTKMNTGMNGDVIDSGKPWGSGINSNRCRDPNTHPTLYTLNGAGAQQGFWKSIDGGVNWARTELPAQSSLQYPNDAYSISVDPYDGQHILMGFHEAVGLLESNDGGETWLIHTPGDDAVSVYFYFVNTGDPATTRATWVSIGQTGNMFRTTNSGGNWTQVNTLEHGHGCSQLFDAGGGLLYAPGNSGTEGNGVYQSKDFGATWAKVADGSANNVIGTPTTLYANYAWANSGGVPPDLRQAPRNPGTQWTAQTAPTAMTNGSKGSAVTYDGSHYVIISGNWNAGIWRYIEP